MKPNIDYTKKNNLCTGCGICENTCPSHAIIMHVEKGSFRPQINYNQCKNAKGCHKCLDVCPGVGINFTQISKECLNFDETKHDKLIGAYIKCFTGHSNDYNIRYHSASGGMVTQLLIWLLEKKYINGAYVTKFNPQNELMVESFLATTKEEIIQSKSSKYSPVTLNTAIESIKSKEGKFIIVGVPCHIQGFRKYERIDKTFKNKILGYFAIYCSSGRTFYLTEHIFKERNICKDNLTYFSYRDEGCLGYMVADGINPTNKKSFHFTEKYQSYYHPLRSFFVPTRCVMCIDHYGELSDVSFGDIHIEPYMQDTIGINSFIVRNPFFLDLINKAQQEGVITINNLSTETLNKSQIMAYKKKYRNATFIRLYKFIGKKVPTYDQLYKDHKILKSLLDFIHTNIQQFIGRHKNLWFIIDILKDKSLKK